MNRPEHDAALRLAEAYAEIVRELHPDSDELDAAVGRHPSAQTDPDVRPPEVTGE